MKILFPLFAGIIFCSACNNSTDKTINKTVDTDTVQQKFFPVTSFIKGEIYEIKKSGINPLQYTTVKKHTDSVWLKIEELDAAVSEFLTPLIDTANLTSLFTEKSFLDQSINAITLTYEPLANLPDSMQLRRWDVYIDPETQKIKRIYMVKEISNTKMLQLTWVSKQWCKITSIITDENGVSSVEKEVKLNWNF